MNMWVFAFSERGCLAQAMGIVCDGFRLPQHPGWGRQPMARGTRRMGGLPFLVPSAILEVDKTTKTPGVGRDGQASSGFGIWNGARLW